MIEFSAPPTVWLVTYLAHSTVALALVWALERGGLLRTTRARELGWRAALLGPLVSATLRSLGLVLVLPASEEPALALARLVVAVAPAATVTSSGLPAQEPGLAYVGHGLDLAGLAWILGAALACVRLARLAWSGRALVRSVEPAPADLVARWRALCSRRGLRAPPLAMSAHLSGPVTPPRNGVRLPPWVASELGAREQDALLLHELAHHRRRDPAWRLLGLLLEALLWGQPLVHLARRRLEALAELAADDQAREAGADGRALAQCLVTCAARPRRAFALASAFDGNGPLSERVERLLVPPSTHPASSAWLRTGAGLGLFALLFAAPGCDPSSLRSGERTSVTTDDSGAVEVTIERSGYRLELTCDVPFVAVDGAPELVTLERDGRFTLRELHAGHTPIPTDPLPGPPRAGVRARRHAVRLRRNGPRLGARDPRGHRSRDELLARDRHALGRRLRPPGAWARGDSSNAMLASSPSGPGGQLRVPATMHRSTSSRSCLPARPHLLWPWLLAALALLLGASLPAAQTHPAEAPVEVEAERVELSVANRPVFVFRGELAGYSPAERRASAEVRLARILKSGGALEISARAAESGTQILVDGELLLTVTPADARVLAGESLESLVADVRARLATALAESAEARSLKAWLAGSAKALAATLAAGLVLALLWRAQRRFSPRIGALAHARSEKLASGDLRVLGQQNLALLARGALLCLAWLVTLAVLFFWLEFTLLCFPFSRALGEDIGTELAQESAELGAELLASLPNLAVVLAIWLLARFVAGVVTRYFAAAQEGLVESRLAEAVTAPVATRIVVALVWLAALVISFPYIPGSGTQAFRGITVFAGLMLSLGSSSIVAQMASGILLAYSRAFRVGDYVRVGEHEGTVVALGLLATKIHTTKNEELSVPNTVFTGGTTTNLSRLSQTSGVFLSTKLTLGYDIPWRKVHELLVGAARKTEGLRAEPAPYVLQAALSDFYVEYELRACLDVPRQRVAVLSRLHAQLLDDFQQAGLQILSPHFLKHGKMTGREGIEP